MTDLSKIKTRIARVLALAGSTTNPQEAETFMQKARDLMEQYQIDALEVETAGGESTDPLGTFHSNEYQPGTPASEKYEVMGSVASYFGCRVLTFGTSKRKRLDIHGAESARATFEMMFPFIWKQVLDLARTRSYEDRKLQRELQRDIGRGLSQRLDYLRFKNKEARKAQAGSGTPGTALVLVGLKARVDEYAEGFYNVPINEAKESRKRGPSSVGRHLAEQISIDRPLGNQSAPNMLN